MDVSLLIADTDSPAREMLRRFFRHCGFLVFTADDALECLDTLQVVEPDILLIDVNLPWGGGDGVVTRITEGLGLSKPPAVLVLGGAPVDVLARRAGVPPSRCFSKPVRMLRLIDAVCLAADPAEPRAPVVSPRAEDAIPRAKVPREQEQHEPMVVTC
ncbi:MAG TPA: response regulator [Thermoguttaceae bacterium]|nr:response regulator [Thermoguttaceae bacterium]